jgi:hypothetical protein
MCVSNYAGVSHLALLFRKVGHIALMGVPASLAQSVLRLKKAYQSWTRIRKLAWRRCASGRGRARCAPTPAPTRFCFSGMRVERASNQVIRLERRLPTFGFGLNKNSFF